MSCYSIDLSVLQRVAHIFRDTKEPLSQLLQETRLLELPNVLNKAEKLIQNVRLRFSNGRQT